MRLKSSIILYMFIGSSALLAMDNNNRQIMKYADGANNKESLDMACFLVAAQHLALSKAMEDFIPSKNESLDFDLHYKNIQNNKFEEKLKEALLSREYFSFSAIEGLALTHTLYFYMQKAIKHNDRSMFELLIEKGLSPNFKIPFIDNFGEKTNLLNQVVYYLDKQVVYYLDKQVVYDLPLKKHEFYDYLVIKGAVLDDKVCTIL